MKSTRKIWMMLAALFECTCAFAQSGTSGGTDSLEQRISFARLLAIRALTTIGGNDLKTDNRELIQFYLTHRKLMLEEIKNSNLKIKILPQDKVQALVDGRKTPRQATTGFYRGAPIVISLELNLSTSVLELTSIIIHELGHHTGHRDENEKTTVGDQKIFLNQLAEVIVNGAMEKDLAFQQFVTMTEALKVDWRSAIDSIENNFGTLEKNEQDDAPRFVSRSKLIATEHCKWLTDLSLYSYEMICLKLIYSDGTSNRIVFNANYSIYSTNEDERLKQTLMAFIDSEKFKGGWYSLVQPIRKREPIFTDKYNKEYIQSDYPLESTTSAPKDAYFSSQFLIRNNVTGKMISVNRFFN